jgi:1-acyl-sn-glycerol-3-phosphate acyltransferase
MKIGKALDIFLFTIVHTFFKSLAWFLLRVFHFVQCFDTNNIPSKGGFIAAANHASFWDPPFLGISTWRRMFRFMARDTLFKFPVWGTLLRYMGAIPIKRGTVDRGAWDKVINTVKDGHIVGLFPEGTRTPDGEIHEGKAGTGMLVYKAKCPVIPVYIHGGFQAWKKGNMLATPFKKMDIIFGKPVYFDEQFKKEDTKQTYIEITGIIMAEIKKLKEEYMAKHGAR